jgi:hypothetical protein
MKILKIQNTTNFKDRTFKVFINGEKHIVDKHFRTFQVPDDKPFEIKARYIWGGSLKYTFEPKDDMVLQVSWNEKFLNMFWGLALGALLLGMAVGWFFEFGLFFGSSSTYSVAFIFYLIFIRKKMYVIREIKE